MLQVGSEAPKFSGVALIDGGFKTIKLDDFKGSYVFLFFYPLDFTYVCPTEIIAFNESVDEFTKRKCKVIACSTDSVHSHLAWTEKDKKSGGVGKLNIPLLGDKSMEISRSYGVLDESQGISFRGSFLIDPEGIIRHITVNDLPIGRSVDETIRTLDAFIFYSKHGEVCPVNWKPNSKTIKPDPVLAKEYFSSVN